VHERDGLAHGIAVENIAAQYRRLALNAWQRSSGEWDNYRPLPGSLPIT
jgi:hypothetical protein